MFSISRFLFLLILILLSCDNDTDLLINHVSENKEVAVVDDNYRISRDKVSILDVLSNDTFSSDNVRIVKTTNPSNGVITINEDNTITYHPEPAISDETATEQTTSEEETTSEENITEENTSEQGTTDETPSTEEEEATGEDSQDETEATEENTSEEESNEQTEEETFTYTTETENEDGTTTTETGTVTVEVETDSETSSEPETDETETSDETRTENDYWRDPVIAGTRFLDEKYYDLDTGEIYSKEVNLQRGQIANYIEHENCPQRIKDKWDNRIEVTADQVNGSQNGLKAIFDTHPRGSLFYLRAGTYQDQKNAILTTDQDVVGEYGAILDGSGITGDSEESTRAIRSMEGGFICNLKVREYPTWNDPQRPENPRGAALAVIKGAILNCEIHSHNVALSVVYGSKAMWNKFTAGRLGIYGYGYNEANHPNSRGAIVKYNEWYGCNFNDYYQHHEAGGSKFVYTDGTVWSHNYIHDNPTGSGIWNDGDNQNNEIYNNVIINTYRSIFIEISHTANIHHNTIEYGTGFGAIYLSNSQGSKVYDNFIRWPRNGITIRDQERGASKIYPGHAHRGINNEIYNNHIYQRQDSSSWTVGMATLFDGNFNQNNTNKWHDNHYYIDDNAEGSLLLSEDTPHAQVLLYSKSSLISEYFALTWAEWKSKSGETNSTIAYAKYF